MPYYFNKLRTTRKTVAPKYIIIKADDYGQYHKRWVRFYNFIKNRKIKATFGINAGLVTDLDFWLSAQTMISSGLVELWNHSYLHEDFEQLSFDETVYSINKNQEVVKDKLGVSMSVFGAPYNHCTSAICKALENHSDITSWFYGVPSSNLNLFFRTANIEDGNLQPDFDMFFADYAAIIANPKYDYICYQVHPAAHNKYARKALGKILDFLVRHGHKFVTVSEYYALSAHAIHVANNITSHDNTD